MRRPLAISITLATLFAVPALHAQTVQGAFVDPSGGPVVGARAMLRAMDGRDAAAATTGPDGGFVLRAPAAGTYTLHVERIGYESTDTPPFALAAGQTVRQQISADPRRIVLPEIVAQGRARCTPRAGSGPQTATVWGEAHKVLGSARESAERGDLRYTVRRYRRELEPASETIQQDTVVTALVSGVSPFVAAPLNRLARHGFVEAAGRDLVFHAPDARVLLSDAFQERHCFWLEEGENGLIGLAFEPVSDARPDVRGTLWLDRSSAELRRMEYSYTRVPGLRPEHPTGGGWMDFTRMPDGRWIVGRWAIRMPVMQATRVQSVNRREVHVRTEVQLHLASIREEGGQVLSAGAATDATPLAAAGFGAVSGTVFDSSAARPLAGARVSLAGHLVTADSFGRFGIAGLDAGEYRLGFWAPRMDSLDYAPAPLRVSVRPGATTELALVIPPLPVVWASGCGTRPEGTGVLVGTLRGERGQPLPGASVTLLRAGELTAAARAAADSQGVYVICDAPAGVPLTLRATARDALVNQPGVVVPPDRPRREDVQLPSRQP